MNEFRSSKKTEIDISHITYKAIMAGELYKVIDSRLNLTNLVGEKLPVLVVLVFSAAFKEALIKTA